MSKSSLAKSPVRRAAGNRLRCEQLEGRAIPSAGIPVPAPAGLVGWWRGNGDAIDAAGQNDGTAAGEVSFPNGMVSQGFLFEGDGSLVQAPSVGLPTGSADRTLELWVRLDSTPAGEAFFAGYGAFGSFDQTFAVGALSDDSLFFSQWGDALIGPALDLGRWYHVAVTDAGGFVTLYLDGASVAVSPMNVDTASGTSMFLGSIPAPEGDFRRLDGMVDEISVYDRALSAPEVLSIYQAGDGGKLVVKATPTVTVNGGSFIFDGQPHPAAGSVIGVNGEDLGAPTLTYSYTDDDGHVLTSSNAPVEVGYYTVTASYAGNDNYNPASASATIMIAFDARTLTDLSKAFKSGRTIPIKLQLLDANGNNLSSSAIDLSAIRLERVNADGSRTQVSLQDSGNSNPDNLFRYDSSLGGYIFNLSTKNLGAGTYDFFWMAEGDPTEHSLRFRLV